ncbi:hypothetical protein P7K49_027978 [Saguinus oedipus]|uniref:Uncharacterized protein n=1 Tax=Saguinus oedipus TaxID=9490 RepID=A0ABQ9UBT9_SAGOE|nr:hypothetical protein P7K49_027978 [Saguinus oedipus]
MNPEPPLHPPCLNPEPPLHPPCINPEPPLHPHCLNPELPCTRPASTLHPHCTHPTSPLNPRCTRAASALAAHYFPQPSPPPLPPQRLVPSFPNPKTSAFPHGLQGGQTAQSVRCTVRGQ